MTINDVQRENRVVSGHRVGHPRGRRVVSRVLWRRHVVGQQVVGESSAIEGHDPRQLDLDAADGTATRPESDPASAYRRRLQRAVLRGLERSNA